MEGQCVAIRAEPHFASVQIVSRTKASSGNPFDDFRPFHRVLDGFANKVTLTHPANYS